MWYLEILQNGVYVIKCTFNKLEDAMMTVDLKYGETAINSYDDIQIHIGYVALRKEN